MTLLPLLLLLLLQHSPAFVTDAPTFAERMEKLYEKTRQLENLNLTAVTELPESKLYAKLEVLNALSPKVVSDDDDELLSVMQQWGLVDPGQLEVMVKELERVREEKSEKMLDGEYSDGEWVDGDLQDLNELDYANDGLDDWDDVDPDSSTVKPFSLSRATEREEIVSAAEAIAATNKRPRILDDSSMSVRERGALRMAAYAHMRNVVRESKCVAPQPRWLSVRQLAPAADTMYMPPCVELYRCSPDSGCCHNEEQVCAPVEGKYIIQSFYLTKADGKLTPARMVFFNHTRCACVSRDTLQTTVHTRSVHENQVDASHPEPHDSVEQNNQVETTQDRNNRVETDPVDRSNRVEANLRSSQSEPNPVDRTEKDETSNPVEATLDGSQLKRIGATSKTNEKDEWRSTAEPTLERDEPTAPPQLRRCSCPTLFLAHITETANCSCVCDWAEPYRRSVCLSFARGREHFGLKDRVCVTNGDCTPPTCEYGVYENKSGSCPKRYRYRRLHFHRMRYQAPVRN